MLVLNGYSITTESLANAGDKDFQKYVQLTKEDPGLILPGIPELLEKLLQPGYFAYVGLDRISHYMSTNTMPNLSLLTPFPGETSVSQTCIILPKNSPWTNIFNQGTQIQVHILLLEALV